MMLLLINEVKIITKMVNKRNKTLIVIFLRTKKDMTSCKMRSKIVLRVTSDETIKKLPMPFNRRFQEKTHSPCGAYSETIHYGCRERRLRVDAKLKRKKPPLPKLSGYV